MHISYQILCELIPGLEKTPARDLADRLTMAGLEVEEFREEGAKLKGILVGEVLTRDKHPNADKLSLCTVSDGKEKFQVVCGAPNVTAGKKYPFATLGTVMPNGLEIKPIKLRGVESSGMLCSAKELEITSEATGLYELDDDLVVGTSIATALGKNDTIFGLNITPNRGDALSHWGVARDVAALMGLKRMDPPQPPLIRGEPKAGDLKISHRDTVACPRYSASTISGVKIAPSPSWLANRLTSLGLRSINNVVDATNYVMLLTGHPVHAFDARHVAGQHIQIYSLTDARSFKTLDGNERALQPGDLVIADANGPVALAGIMGGENSQVADDTTDLILEVAFFDPVTIRKTSRRLGLQTDSSYRFERFVNPESIPAAHRVLIDLILEIAGGVASTVVDSYPKPWLPKNIVLPRSEMRRLLGIEVSDERMTTLLTALGCRVETRATDLSVTVPVGRSDLERPVDLVEEVARLHGFDQIPTVMPRLLLHSSQEDLSSQHEKEIMDFFVAQGFSETVHYSFGDPEYFEKILSGTKDQWLSLKNPLSQDLQVMRPSLLPNLLQCYKKNHLNTDRGIRIFERRKVYRRGEAGRIIEASRLACLYAGNPLGRNPYGLVRESDFHDGKGLLRALFAKAQIRCREEVHQDWPYHSGQAVSFFKKDVWMATVGALHPELLQILKIKEKVYYVECDDDLLAREYKKHKVVFQNIGSLPPVYRDVALLAPKSLTHAEIMTTIRDLKPDFLKHIELFDLYEGSHVPEGKKSVGYSLVYQAEGESLTDEVVNKIHFGLVEELQKKLGVELR